MASFTLGSLSERSERGSWRSQLWVAMRVDCRKGRPGKIPPRSMSDFPGQRREAPAGPGPETHSKRSLEAVPGLQGAARAQALGADWSPPGGQRGS